MKKTTKKGFTLVELVIVIAIIAILAAVLIPTFSGVVKKANESKALQEIKNAHTEALAECLANDGAVTIADASSDKITSVTANNTNFDIVSGIYTFTVDANGALQADGAKETSNAKYTYTVTNGVITAATTVNN